MAITTGSANPQPVSYVELESMRMQPSQEEGENIATLECRPRHTYVFRRPRPLQFTRQSHTYRPAELEILRDNEQMYSGRPDATAHGRSAHHIPLVDTIDAQRGRLDLFIDLVWVGIISNISDIYANKIFGQPKSSASEACLLFVVAHLPSWRIWNLMREFLNDYYMSDAIQRAFVLLLLIFSVLYGNNLAYVVGDTEKAKIYCISLYLVIRASMVLMQLVYSYFIPWQRKLLIVIAFCNVPSIALFIAAMYINGLPAIAAILPAIILDSVVPFLADLRILNKLVDSEYQRAVDQKHFSYRMLNFFIITLGEGVFGLIQQGPLGLGITAAAGPGAWCLMIYFLLTYLYINGDSSRVYRPAGSHKGWRMLLSTTAHIPLFMGALTLSAGLDFVIHVVAPPQTANDQQEPEIPEDQIHAYTRRAMWTVALSLTIVVTTMTFLALLDVPHPTRARCRVQSRYGRLSGRLVYLISILVAMATEITAGYYLGLCGLALFVVNSFEWIASTDKGGGIFEPKSLADLVSQDLRS